MKKFLLLLTAFLFSILLAACGTEEKPENAWKGIGPGADLTAITERTEYYDLAVESEELFKLGLWEKNPEEYLLVSVSPGETFYALLGTQFAFGEPAQLWSELSSNGADIYLYRTDGSRELLLQGISSDYASAQSKFQCYMDRERNCYFYRTDYPRIDGEYTYVGTIVKIAPSGEILYKNTLEQGLNIQDICQAADGKIYLLLRDRENDRSVLEELDPDAGQLIPESRMELSLGEIHLGTSENSLVLAGNGGGSGGYKVEAVDMAAQSTSALLYFQGTSYGWHFELELKDFRVLEDGSLEFLWTDRDGLTCLREKMRMEKVEKTPIVLRGVFFADTWLGKEITRFNQENDDYFVVAEICGAGNDVEDFARLTSVQVGAGKGPDILCGDYLLHDYIGGMTDKGALEALNPYMEASGIREEDYFPLVFSSWRQGEIIYGVTPKMEISYEEMDAQILGSQETPDIETLADALLAWEGTGIYRRRLTSGQLLNSFLQGSEDLWGMVDWETGSCDFDTPLFGKLLEVAGRYGWEPRRELEPEVAYSDNLDSFFHFYSAAEREEKGRVFVGTLFDDGCHGVSLPLYTMAVNANSVQKEGAWEFISFLLGEEVQGRKEQKYLPPVRRESFEQWLEWHIYELSAQHFENGRPSKPPYYGENTSAEKQEEYRKAIEDVRPLPMRTAPVLTIVLEEAEYYFNGSKNAEAVSKLINNRVQVYLDEQK